MPWMWHGSTAVCVMDEVPFVPPRDVNKKDDAEKIIRAQLTKREKGVEESVSGTVCTFPMTLKTYYVTYAEKDKLL